MIDAGITFQDLSVSFGSTHALGPLTGHVSPGEFVSILGPSGCGKSTLLRVIGGLQGPTSGRMILSAGSTALMPQQDCLLPWRRAMPNALLGARITGRLTPAILARAAELFVEFGLGGFETAWPHELSGGMRQRLALLRTYLTGKPTLLLDEPFGALDAMLRRQMNLWLVKVWRSHPRTTVLVTHDVEEALLLSDRILLLSPRPGTVVAELAGCRDNTQDLPRARDNLLNLLRETVIPKVL